MLSKDCPLGVLNAYVLALRPDLIDLVEDRRPNKAARGVFRCTRLSLYAHYCPHGCAKRCAVSTKENHCGRTVSGNVGTSSVDYVRKVESR